jgi:hypothetical protein
VSNPADRRPRARQRPRSSRSRRAPSAACPGPAVDGKAAFNNFPYAYGVVERTYSELKASLLDTLPSRQYATLPAELQQGALALRVRAGAPGRAGRELRGRDDALLHLPDLPHGADGRRRAAALNPPVRGDLARHDLTGGNYWMP